MSYTAFQWKNFSDGGTPITADRLNAIEQGLQEASEAASPPDGSRDGYANFLSHWHGVSDGVTEMSFGLNQALAAGGVLYLPPGDYLCSEPLYIQSVTPTILTGPGRIVSMFDGPILTVNNGPHIIDGIRIMGAGLNLNNQSGITVYADDAVVQSSSISSVSGWGIYAQGANVRIEDNSLDHCSLGTLSDSASTATVYATGNYVKCVNNTLTNTQTGIAFEGVDYSAPIVGGLLQGNRVSARDGVPPQTLGISSKFAQYQRTVNNEVSGYPSNCLHEYGSQFTVIADNVIHDGQRDGIFVGSELTQHITITGNDIVRVSVGIRAWDNAASVEISGNSVADSKFGIMAFGAINPGEQWLSDIRIENNNITADGSQVGGFGIGVKNTDGFTVAQNTAINANHEGVYLESCSTGMVRGNQVRQPSVDSSGAWAAIHATGNVARVLIDDNLLDGGAEVGVLIDSGATGIRVRGNRWHGIPTGVTDNGSGTTVSDNASF